MNVAVTGSSRPDPDAPAFEHEAAERSHESHRADYGHNQQNDHVKFGLGIHGLLRSLGSDTTACNCTRTRPKNKKGDQA
jgi:hypothetical protein